MLRPQLAGPACGQLPPGHYRQPGGLAKRCGGRARDLRGAVAALVVDKKYGKFAGIILLQERCYGSADAVGLIAGRYDGDNRRPRSLARPGSVIVLAAEPKASACNEKVDPDCHHHDANRSLATDSPQAAWTGHWLTINPREPACRLPFRVA